MPVVSHARIDPRCSGANEAAYLFCSDAQVGQWAIDEAQTLTQLVRKYDRTNPR